MNQVSTSENQSQPITPNAQQKHLRQIARERYWWGVLGIIPCFGALVGIALLILGSFHYKDKILALIGVACILLTVGVISFQIYFARNNPNVANLLAKTSQQEINHLVKEIEFYKLQNGSYPDSVQQLYYTDKHLSFSDPLRFRNPTKVYPKYLYKKIGDNYNLHSVGLDRIDNTSDDIYPTIPNRGGKQFGFITK